MSFAPQSTSVFVSGPDPTVREAIARLLSLDAGLRVVGMSAATSDASTSRAAVVVDEGFLHEFKDLSIGNFIDMVKSLPAPPPRHLTPIPGSAADARALLTERELQVVRLLAEGLTNKEISLRLELSDKTVKNHISHVLAKLHLTARTQVAVHALRTGLA